MDEDQTEEETELATLEELDRNLDNEEEEIEDVLDDRPMKVQEGLYIGSCMAEMNKSSLLKAGITDILQVAQGLFPHHPLVFNYMNIQVQDIPSEDLVIFFPKCFEFIDRAVRTGGAVLVHCAAGVSRSATVVLGYLMTRYDLELAAALNHLKAIRPWVAPNLGFMEQLAAYEGLAHDMSKWRAWHNVWHAKVQQQQQQPQQRWLQIQQVHACCSPQQSNSRDICIAGAMDGISDGSSSRPPSAAPTVDSLRGQSSTTCMPCDWAASSCRRGSDRAQVSNGFSGPIRILCDGSALCGPSAAACGQPEQLVGNPKRQFKYSSSAPELGYTLASPDCPTAVNGVPASCLNPGACRQNCMESQACSYSSGSSSGTCAADHGSCSAFSPAWRGYTQQWQIRDQQQATATDSIKRHVAFALDDLAPSAAAAAATAASDQAVDIKMEDTVPGASAF